MTVSSVPLEKQSSKAEQYVISKGWNYRVNGDQIVIETCPYCAKNNYHFYMAIGGRKDGLHDCKVCGKSANLWHLMEHLGDRMEGVQSMQDLARSSQEKEDLPNIEACHTALMGDPETVAYLEDVRGFTMEVIERQKLGLIKRYGAKWLVIPYLQKGQCVYAKYRTLPPAEKKFEAPRGWETPLYNQEVIQQGMEELIFVEGEADTLSLLSQGELNVVGVPGANTKKTTWVTLVDNADPKKIYILYDSDKVGKKAAHEMAVKLGIEKVFNIALPDFEVEYNGETRKGKDINEWFQAGNSLEDFEVLKKQAKRFDVLGVTNLLDALGEIEADLEGREDARASYDSPWDCLNRKWGGAEPGDVIDVIAEAKIGKSTMTLNFLDYLIAKYKESGLYYCLEMPQKRVARKWVSYVTQTDDSPPVNNEEAKAKAVIMKAAIKAAKLIALEREADLLFAFTRVQSADDVFETIRQAVRRYGVKFVVFDNLQLLCDLTLKNANNRTVHISQVSKRFKALATELNIVVIRVIQPNRVREGEIVDSRNADGSSAIEKDCDTMIALHRNRRVKIKQEDFAAIGFMDEEMAFEPQMLVRVALSRYAPGGVTTLMFDGATSTVREFVQVERDSVPKLHTSGNVVPMEKREPVEV